MKKIRVLFIDDDGSVRTLAGALFNNNLFSIQIAENTEQADKLLQSEGFDVIVCDVLMPGEDGIHFCNRLKAKGNKIPFLFLSALSQPDYVANGLAAGAQGYLVKPFDAKDLQRQIIKLSGVSLTPQSSDKNKK